MWHEARKQEKKIRGMFIDYKRRAERRREYYEKTKLDPTQFIQLHGRVCKIHLDPSVHFAAEAPGSMMPWRGDDETMIDRFDVRAHLDGLPAPRKDLSSLSSEELWEERQCNYERYRILIQNEFLAVKEEKFLNQIRQEELFGPVGSKTIEEEKKLLAPKKAAIGFVYDDSPLPSSGSVQVVPPACPPEKHSLPADEDSEEDSDDEMDLDLSVDVMSLSMEQQRELNRFGMEFNLQEKDFMDLMSKDLEEVEALRVAKFHEDEKAMFSGRKSRKERRALKRKLIETRTSPPSYAAPESPTRKHLYALSSRSSGSRSPSPPVVTSRVKYITSFGDESDPQSDGDAKRDAKGDAKDGRNAREIEKRKSLDRRSSHPVGLKDGNRRQRTTPSRRSSRDRSRSSSTHRDRRSSLYPSVRSRSIRDSSSRHSSSRHSSSSQRRRSRSWSRPRSRSDDRSRYRHSKHRRSSRSSSRSKSPFRQDGDLKTKQKSLTKSATTEASNWPSPPRKRYYGRRANDSSESDSCDSSDSDQQSKDFNDSNKIDSLSGSSALSTRSGNGFNVTATSSSCSLVSSSTYAISDSSRDKGLNLGSSKITPQERLKKKMQALLRKQYKADKKQQKERQSKAEQERLDREEELREIALKMRKRERERRHNLRADDESYSDDSLSGSRSRSKSPETRQKYDDKSGSSYRSSRYKDHCSGSRYPLESSRDYSKRSSRSPDPKPRSREHAMVDDSITDRRRPRSDDYNSRNRLNVRDEQDSQRSREVIAKPPGSEGPSGDDYRRRTRDYFDKNDSSFNRGGMSWSTGSDSQRKLPEPRYERSDSRSKNIRLVDY